MLKFIAIFGPPGAGKSTIINYAKKCGYKAYDLELGGESYKARLRKAKTTFKKLRLHWEKAVLFGAADLKVKDFPPGTRLVMILPGRKEYIKRINKRDQAQPHKVGQGGVEFKYDKFKALAVKFDLVIRGSKTKGQTLKRILNKFLH